MKQPKTPFFLIREKDLLYDISLLKDSLSQNWGNYIAGYSVKTNSLPWLLTYLKSHGFYAEVVSKNEYDLALRMGFLEKQIIYNGPVKDKKVFESLLLSGGYINLDSNYELDWMEEFSASYPNRHLKIGLRVNCDIASLCPEEEPAFGECGRFGYCYENGVLKNVIDRLSQLPNVRISGLHLHTSTKSRSVQVFGALAKMAVRIAKEYNLSLSYVDMGGGYFGGRDDMPNYQDYFKEIGKELSAHFDPRKTILIAEPGVSLISRATTFETAVIDVKDIRGRKFVVTDGSRTNLNPLVTRHVYPHHMEYLSDPSIRNTEPSQWVCGATCMEYDKLFEINDGPALVPGDKVIYDTAGGYTMCLNPLFINYFPAVYVEREDHSLFKARETWTNEEFLQKNYF